MPNLAHGQLKASSHTGSTQTGPSWLMLRLPAMAHLLLREAVCDATTLHVIAHPEVVIDPSLPLPDWPFSSQGFQVNRAGAGIQQR
jgi:hypothetical protein